MPNTIIESVLSGKLSAKVLAKWLNNDLNEEGPEDSALFCCSRSEFVAYFLSYLRNQTDKILQTNTNALQVLQHQSTPEKLFNSHRQHRRSISEPNASEQDGETRVQETIAVSSKSAKANDSPGLDRSHKKQGRRVKTKLFLEAEPLHKSKSHEHSLNRSASSSRTDSDESRISSGVERLVISSTPMKNGIAASEYPCLPVSSPVTPKECHSRTISRHSSYSQLPKEHHERCDTPRISHRSRTSNPEKSMPSLGDYIVNAQPSKSSKKKRNNSKNQSNDSTSESQKIDLDLSSSDMFPEIGVKRLSSSLRYDKERRRIKPTNLDSASKRSFSLNSFNSESFQQPSPLAMEENSAFKYQKLTEPKPKESAYSFEAERSILKLERQKLMEKFNVLNTATSPKAPVTPQIKIMRKESLDSQKYVDADVNEVNFKDKLDTLVGIYDNMLKCNLVLSVSSEVYFLISILLSRQCEEDYIDIQGKLSTMGSECNDDTSTSEYILRSVHNCSYFAVKMLWRQKYVLELMLDKSSLKLLGENKRVRSFYPELAKFLLNLYGLKCEAENFSGKDDKCDGVLENQYSNGIVCFNFETDNADNFPSVLSFHNFKKQRDMFYEILRWWHNPGKQGGCLRTSLRSRVKSLLSLAVCPANHAHLARLMRDHILAECASNVQESKLSKLQRRLVGPATTPGGDSNRLPKFTAREQFYKEVIMFAGSESFRCHLKEALIAELVTLDANVTLSDLRTNASDDITKEYLTVVKKLRLLAKFLGLVVSLPYTQVPVEHTIKTGMPVGYDKTDQHNVTLPPRERVLESQLAIRDHSQPPINLKEILMSSYETHRLAITLPWLMQYLAMMDYTTLRTRYYSDLTSSVFAIFNRVLRADDSMSLPRNGMKRSTVIYLKLCLGWLFDMPHFPQDSYYKCAKQTKLDSQVSAVSGDDMAVDFLELVDETVLFEICPYLKEFNVLLLTSRPSDGKDMGSFRHITPVTMSLNANDRIKNKEKEIQARLEEELIKSQPSSTRRVLDMVTERATSATVKELTATLLQQARAKVKVEALRAVKARSQADSDHSALLQTLQTLYAAEARALLERARAAVAGAVRARAGPALGALLPAGGARPVLEAVVVRACVARLLRWLDDTWGTHAILCKDLEAEMRNMIVLGEGALPSTPHAASSPAPPLTPATPRSPAPPRPAGHHASPAAVLIQLKELICQVLEQEPCSEVISTLELARQCCSYDNMFYNAATTAMLHQLARDLCLVYISKRPTEVSHELLVKLDAVWSEGGAGAEAPEPRGEADVEGGPSGTADATSKHAQDQEAAGLFDRFLCPRNVAMLGGARQVWSKMADALVFLMSRRRLGEDSLTEQCLAVYRQDWPQNTLEGLSHCMRSVSEQWGRSSGGKFTLFLDFLAEYCDDMDYGQDASA